MPRRSAALRVLPTALPVVALLLACLRPCAGDYHAGDVVPSSRRGQFHASRTQWHDLQGRLCPRFGLARTVALPLPRPVGFQPGDEYKLQLAFGFAQGGADLTGATPWLLLLGPAAPSVPLVDVELVHALGGLVAVHAAVGEAPQAYARLHAPLLADWRNDSHWPKHALVHYRWHEERGVDAESGVAAALFAGLLLSVAAWGTALLAPGSLPPEAYGVVAGEPAAGDKVE